MLIACPEEAAAVEAAINAIANAGEIEALRAKIASREGLIRSLTASLYQAKAEARASRDRCAVLESRCLDLADQNRTWRICA